MSAGTRGVDPELPIDRSIAPPPSALRPFRFPGIRRSSLSNGMRVVYAPARRFPVATVTLVLDAGGMRDPQPLLGLAALTAALLESGAGERTAAQIASDVERLGVQLDTGVGWDTAQAGVTALASRVPAALDVLADLVRRPRFPDDEVDRIRAERVAELLQRRSDPRALAAEAAARFIYSPDSRVARPLAGTERSLPRLHRADIVAFHAGHFSPAAATLVVVGDLDADTAVELLEARFGDWAGPALQPLRPVVGPRTDAAEVVIVDRPGAVQSELRVGHLGVPRTTPDYFPILVMNGILGGTFSSRLNLNLRERHGYTYGASSGFSMRRHSGAFVVSAAVQTEVTAAALAEILAELRRIRADPVAAAELDDARNYFAGVFPLRLQTTDGIAGRLLEMIIYDLPLDYVDGYRDRVADVTAEQVLDAARRYVDPDRVVAVVVGDADRLRAPIEALGIGSIRVVAPDAIQDSE